MDAVKSVSHTEIEAAIQDPSFGSVFSTHMASVQFTNEKGWHKQRIEPYAPISLAPSSMSLHYGQEIFEGLKAYPQLNGGVSLFRPEANAQRFARSASRLAMPELPESLFVESVRALTKVDQHWVPKEFGSSLYLRPVMFATEPALGVKPASEFGYYVMACPVGDYFKGRSDGVTLWASETYTRACIGGTGEAKCAGNYAASLAAQAEARSRGCDQVVFLDAVEHRWIEELGGMNIFFVFEDGSLQTPPLRGTILPGITRESLIILARSMGLVVREAPYSLEQWELDSNSGRLVESFACGTAAAITPISRVKTATTEFSIGDGKTSGGVTSQLKSSLLDIQFGRADDKFNWMQRVI